MQDATLLCEGHARSRTWVMGTHEPSESHVITTTLQGQRETMHRFPIVHSRESQMLSFARGGEVSL